MLLMVNKFFRLRYFSILVFGSLVVVASLILKPALNRATLGDGKAGVTLGVGAKPFIVELGNLQNGSVHMKSVRLTNPTAGSILIDSFLASCECTSVIGLPVEVPGGGSREVLVSTDFTKEPEFTGGLSITVELRARKSVEGNVQINCNVVR